MNDWLGVVKELLIAAIWATFLGFSVAGLGDLMYERAKWMEERSGAMSELLGRGSTGER